MNSIAEKCPAKLCAAAVFFMCLISSMLRLMGLLRRQLRKLFVVWRSSRFCHLYDDCEETDADRSALLLQREAAEVLRSCIDALALLGSAQVTALQAWPGALCATLCSATSMSAEVH